MVENLAEPRCVLITGGCGFIGSNFINFIADRWKSSRIVNYDKLAFGASPYHVEKRIRESNRYTFIEARLEDQDILDRCLHEHQVGILCYSICLFLSVYLFVFCFHNY
ncbi:hypothetical protein ANCCAN_14576 [Ancylostoma caninum]|uniref:NAD(P)-binding domain-containing protein n=1 Tax=Ancylostoma caninum TaxID=29170 RepID=A0A368G505_ANCCA|nr:hypothetical protein ANCCAN_14576 [Ancylostoma caninum]